MEIDEEQLRKKIRRNLEELDSSLTDRRPPEIRSSESEQQIRLFTEKIVAEETESYFREQGLVKYESTTGRVYWLTPEQRESRIARRQKRRRKTRIKKEFGLIDRKKALAIAFFMLVVIIFVWVLFETGIFNIG